MPGGGVQRVRIVLQDGPNEKLTKVAPRMVPSVSEGGLNVIGTDNDWLARDGSSSRADLVDEGDVLVAHAGGDQRGTRDIKSTDCRKGAQ